MPTKTIAAYAADTNPAELTWASRGLCHGAPDPDTWFPNTDNPEGRTVRRAVALCMRCPVMGECLEFALDNDERYGIWGGTTTAQRARIRRNGRRAA